MIVAEKGREAAGFESSFRESSGVKRLEYSVSSFDMQVAKANLVPGKGYNSLSPLLGKYRWCVR